MTESISSEILRDIQRLRALDEVWEVVEVHLNAHHFQLLLDEMEELGKGDRSTYRPREPSIDGVWVECPDIAEGPMYLITLKRDQ